MTKSEYQDLVEFLGRKFDAIDRRFTGLEGRMDGLETRLTRVEVLCEENRHQIQIVAEGVVSLREEMIRRFEDHRVLIEGLGARVTRLEAKIA